MARERDPRQVLHEAKQIARDYGCRVAEVKPDSTTTHYVLYRTMPGCADVRIGRRSTPAGIYSLVCKATGFH